MISPPLLSTTRVLAVSDVSVERDGHLALDRITLDAHAGRLLVVVGPNGSGKSTLLGVAAGLLAPRTGTARTRPDARIALVPQSTHLPAHLPLTVRDLVAMGTWGRLGAWRPLRHADRRAIAEAIATVGLTELTARRIGTLSGGQRQRALIAQALVQRADLVLLDEPMAGLDSDAKARVATAVKRLVRSGAAVVAVTHDRTELTGVDAVLELDGGRGSLREP